MPSLARLLPIAVAFTLLPAALAQQAGTPTPGPQTDTSVIEGDGTAHITRVVPLPADLSPEARARWSKPVSDAAHPQTLAERRAGTDTWQTGAGKKSASVYPVKITEGQTVAGVPVRIIDPLPNTPAGPVSGPGSPEAPDHPTGSALFYSSLSTLPCRPGTHQTAPVHAGPSSGDVLHPELATPVCGRPASPTPVKLHPDRVLICLHGGGFNSDSGSYTEAIPIANLSGIRVVSVLYRLAPEHPFPAALDDAVAVYRELLKQYQPAHIAVYGTSAGAILTGELAVRLKELALPQPGALGIFSGFGDAAHPGDSASFFSLEGLSGHLDPPKPTALGEEYTAGHPLNDPVLSPNMANLHGLPPTLFITSTRDLLLSGTVTMQRAWARDAVPTQMTVFDGLPHAFWNDVSLPESREAYATMARFFLENLVSRK